MDNASREKLHSQEASQSQKGPESQGEKQLGTKEVKQKTSELLKSQGVDAAEDQEGAEFSEGKVSEVSSEDKAHAAQGGAGKAYSSDEIEAIRAKLLAALPPQEDMIRQIRKKLGQQEKILTKRMKKLQKKPHRNAFHLTVIVSQLRKVREYFSKLAHATYELVKHLWLEIVHGV